MKEGKYPEAYAELSALVRRCEGRKLYETPFYSEFLTNLIYVCYLMEDKVMLRENLSKYADLEEDLKEDFENIRTLFWVFMRMGKYS